MTHQALIDAIRAWLLLALAASSPTVIEQDKVGVRAVLPYLVINIPAAVTVGTDEEIMGLDGSGNPTRTIRGLRQATVSVDGFGTSTFDQLEDLALSARTNASRALNTAAGIEVMDFGGITDVATLLDTQREKRFLREFQVQYEVTLVEVLTEVLEFRVEVTYMGPQADLTETITITV